MTSVPQAIERLRREADVGELRTRTGPIIAADLRLLLTQYDAAVEALRSVRKVREGYASQLKFCDIEAHGYFREFLRRIDDALLSSKDCDGGRQ